MTVVDPRRERQLARDRALLKDPVRRAAMDAEMTADDETQILLDAAQLVIVSALGSWKMLQRKMRLGQGHAQRVLDILEMRGVVGPEVAGQRRVLVDRADLEEVLERLRSATAPHQPPRSQEAPGDDLEAPGGDAQEVAPTPVSLQKVPVGESASTLVKRLTTTLADPSPTTLTTPEDEADDEGGDGGRLRPLLVGRIIQGGGQAITTLREGEGRTVRATRGAARYTYVAGQGMWFWIKRATKASNHGHAREQLRMARMAGLPDEIERWDKNLEARRNGRIKRLRQLPDVMKALGITTVVIAGAAMVALVVVGVLIGVVTQGFGWGSFPQGWRFWWWCLGWAGLLVAAIVVVAAFLSLTLSIPVTIAKAHEEGRKRAKPPRWMLSLNERVSEDAEITPTRVAIALRDCGLAALKAYIKESPDQGAELLGPITPDGKGVGVLVRLISTVSTTDVLKRRDRIAEACDRHQHELLMNIPKPHHVYMWFANPGVLEEPIGPSPLVTSPTQVKVNMEKGKAPWGETLKGDPVGVNLWQQMLLITGLSNQGKTRAMRALALWLAPEPHVHFWIANLKGVEGDWDMFRDLCDPGRFIKGPGIQHAIDATLMVEAAWAEMERRLNSGQTDWDPLVVIIDEAQKAYMNPEKDDDGIPYGGQANNSRYCRAIREIHNQGRAVNVVTWEGTQDPTNQNLPKITREGNHIRISLVVGTPEQARMALGAAAVDGLGGGAPHLLRKDIDAGTVVMHGGKVPIPLGEKAITVRTYHINDAEAWTVAGRALAKRRSRGGMPMVIDAAPEKVDHLMHINEAMRGEDVVRTVVVLGRLMEDRPDIYEEWDSQDTTRVINAYTAAGHDIAVRKRMSGQSCLVLAEVETVLRERADVLP